MEDHDRIFILRNRMFMQIEIPLNVMYAFFYLVYIFFYFIERILRKIKGEEKRSNQFRR